jgi:hypothetical protein
VEPDQTALERHAKPSAGPAVSSFGQARPGLNLAARTELVLLVLTILSGLTTWAVGIHALGYDYDEVMRAHSSWLAAQGLRPYRDFLDCHPPYFRMLAPIVRACAGDPCAVLWSLRILSATGNLLFLGGLAALGASRVQSGTWSALFGLAIVAFQPTVLHYLVEFRIDGWGYALAVWSIYRFRRDSRGGYRDFELGLLTGIATLLFCPKLALLPPLIILSDQIVARASARGAVRAMVAYLGGAGFAAVLFALYLTWQGIDFDQTFQLLVRYNAISNVNLGIHLGLLQSIPSSACARLLSGDWRIVPYTAGQREALGGFVRRRGYQAVHFGNAWFALRPDRFEQAQRGGLLDAIPRR